MAPTLPSLDAWTRARNRYIEDLTLEEKQLYMQATPEKIFYDASAAEKRHEAGSTSRGLMHKLQPFVAAIEQFGEALDVYSNAYPLALSPLWGSIRIVLLIAREFGKYFEKLVDMLARIGDVLPRFQVYEKLFSNHERLKHALSVAYVDVIVFCSDVKEVFRRGQRSSLTSLKVGFKLIWKPFESQFGQQLDNFRNHRKNVEKEAGLSHMVEAADSRALVLANHLQLERMKKENEYHRLIAMIQSVDVEAKHRRLQSLRFQGTGDWVLQNDKYLRWKQASSSSFLCCCGIPGSGKSVLASRIVDDLSTIANPSQATIVYYYCDYADQRTLQTDRILGTILKRLLPDDAIPKEVMQQILQAYRNGQRTPGSHEIVNIVCTLMQKHPVAYVVLDGLDECEKQPRQDILNFLNQLATFEKVSIHTLVTCRDEDQLLRSVSSYPRIQLTAVALGSDIELFVKGSVRSRIDFGQLTMKDPDLEHQIVQELVDKAHGMFLWIFFQLDDLCEAISDAMIRQILRDLPVGLVQTYERILLKISKYPLSKQEIAQRAFRWTLCSRRPMKIEELQEAVAFEISDTSWDNDKIPDENLMITTCKGLLVRDEDMTVRFAHHTVQQYLLSAPAVVTQEKTRFRVSSLPEAEGSVGQLCLTYLCFSDFETQIALRPQNVKLESLGVLKAGGPANIPTVLGFGKSLLDIPYRLLGGKPNTAPLKIDYSKYLTPNKSGAPSPLTEKYRLLEYIVEYWIDHTKDLGPPHDSKLRRLAMHQTLSFEFRPWGLNQHFGSYGCVGCPSPINAKDLPLMSLFHYAAHVGHWKLMEGLVTEYGHHEHPFYETLLIACRQGQYLIVEKIMPNINYDISDGRAINAAVAAGHADILNHFLDLSERGAKHGRSSTIYNFVANATSLLTLAATNGHETVVDAILNRCHLSTEGFDASHCINGINERTGLSLFFLAVVSGNEELVSNLLKRGAKLQAHGTSALHVAAECGCQGVFRMLLNSPNIETYEYMGADTEYNQNEGAYYHQPKEVYSLLHFFDSTGSTLLHKAAMNGHSAIVKSILDSRSSSTGRGLDLEVRTSYQSRHPKTRCTALHLAASTGHIDVVKILVENGASIESKTYDSNWTPLHFAASGGHEDVVRYLLQKGASPYVDARDGAKVLEVALLNGRDGVVRALLEYDYQKLGYNANNTEMARLIEKAAESKEQAVLRALLDWVGIFEEGHLREIQQVATRKGYYRALGVLKPLQERLLLPKPAPEVEAKDSEPAMEDRT